MKSGLPHWRRFWLAPLVLLVLLVACGDDDEGPTGTEDSTAPAPVTTLATGAVTAHSIVLNWTAVGDDSLTGTARTYDVRYSTSAITAGNFAAATAATGEPSPTAVGTPQTMTVTGLAAAMIYHFALKVADEKSNWSGISNVVSDTTAEAGDETVPAPVNDLDGTALSSNSVLLTWTAPGDDGSTGTAAAYDIRYSTNPISGTNWNQATQATGEPAPAVAGTEQEMTVTGLTAEEDYYFAMKTRDEVPNESSISNIETVSTPAAQASPPGLMVPDFPDSVCITSEETYAQFAKASVELQLMLVNYYAALANAFFAPLQGADWEQTGDCWNYDYSYAGCAVHYDVCQTEAQYEYTMTIDGSCGSEPFDNWVEYRAQVDTDARTGTFYVYELNTTTVAAAWTWTWAADENSGTYTFYDGDPATEPISATIEWSRSADLNVYDVTYIVPEQTKTVTHFVQEPCSGWQHQYQWDSEWWMQNDIVWNSDGSGYWDTYEEGNPEPIEHYPW
jgi:hypothetical protein